MNDQIITQQTQRATQTYPGNQTAEKLTTLLLAAQGDLKMVKEKVNYKLLDDEPHLTEADVLTAFLETASTSVQVMDSIKALMLLNYLQMLNEARGALTSAFGADSLSLNDVTRTIQMIITGVAEMLPQAPVQNNNTINLLQAFGMEGAGDRVKARLETYAKVDEKYGNGEGSS